MRLIAVADFFSIGLLAKTLFSPFRQISAGNVSGPIGVQLRAFFDRLVSRFVGAFVRTSMIIIGTLALFLQSLLGFVTLIIWLIFPFLPVAGLILCVIGVVPKW